MTAQIPDTYRYYGRKYEVIAMTSPIEFDPREYGLCPTAPHTACWRGYVCGYEITEEGLFLSELSVHCSDGNYPELDGVEPDVGGHFAVYRNLRHRIDFTGSIVVGRSFIDDYYIHMGFQRAWAYRFVFELVFEHGELVRTIDHSRVVAEIRKRIEEDPDFLDEMFRDRARFVHDSFSLDPDVKAWWI